MNEDTLTVILTTLMFIIITTLIARLNYYSQRKEGFKIVLKSLGVALSYTVPSTLVGCISYLLLGVNETVGKIVSIILTTCFLLYLIIINMRSLYSEYKIDKKIKDIRRGECKH